MNHINIIWFRRGLRLHDNPALHAAIENCQKLLAIYIFDTEFPGLRRKSYHQTGFLLEALADLDNNLHNFGGKLHIFQGNPVAVFQYLHSKYNINKLCFQQDCEPIWNERDSAVKEMCNDLGIEWIEKVSHTLWDPADIIAANGGTPPLTYDMFVHVAMSLGEPPRPMGNVDFRKITFLSISHIENESFQLFSKLPTVTDVGVAVNPVAYQKRRLVGGESQALHHLASRLQVEEAAFRSGLYQPNQAKPDLLGPPMSLSAALALGCVSVRLFYWSVHDLYNEVNRGNPPAFIHITGQLIWREYFYTMSKSNPSYDRVENNPICLNIRWAVNDNLLNKWKNGQTGYPFIDAALRQLLQEGWIHHVARNAIAMFLTRGDLWISWEEGADHFLEHLVDSDWSVNSGNWLWVSSSAFERVLNCSICISPVLYGRRLEPSGEYIRRYVPELANYGPEYIHEPWKAPIEFQRDAQCIIGQDYPERMVIHEEASRINQNWMFNFRIKLMEKIKSTPPHCQPSSEQEVYQFFCIPEQCYHNVD